MINDLIGAVTTLFEYSDRFKEAEAKKSQEIADHFQKIEKSLLKSVEELQNSHRSNKHYHWSKLKSYAEDLPKILGEVIGQDKAQNISNQLTIAIGDNPSDDINVPQLKSLAGMFSALADNVTIKIGTSNGNQGIFSRNRRNFICTAIGRK